jgi:hypothetical protein
MTGITEMIKNYSILKAAAKELKDAYKADLCDGLDWHNEEEQRIFNVKYPNLMQVIVGIMEFAEHEEKDV